MTTYYVFILLNIFLIINALLILTLLLQNIIRNTCRTYVSLRSKPFIDKANELIIRGKDINKKDFIIFLPYDRMILSQVLLGLLANFSGNIRSNIINCLEQLGIVEKYISQLRSLSIKRKFNAIEKLGEINSPLAVEKIAAMLNDRNKELRLAAVRTLTHHQNSSYLPKIIKGLPRHTDLTILAMLLSFGKDLDELLLKILTRKVSIPITNNIIILAGERRNIRSIAPLKRELITADPYRKTLLHNALCRCGVARENN